MKKQAYREAKQQSKYE
jgi:hypothetical protein